MLSGPVQLRKTGFNPERDLGGSGSNSGLSELKRVQPPTAGGIAGVVQLRKVHEAAVAQAQAQGQTLSTRTPPPLPRTKPPPLPAGVQGSPASGAEQRDNRSESAPPTLQPVPTEEGKEKAWQEQKAAVVAANPAAAKSPVAMPTVTVTVPRPVALGDAEGSVLLLGPDGKPLAETLDGFDLQVALNAIANDNPELIARLEKGRRPSLSCGC